MKKFNQICKNIISEMIINPVKNNIKDGLVYHASPFKLQKLEGSATKTWSGQTGSVFVTPFKSIACCFLINKDQIYNHLKQQLGGDITGLNYGYDIWNLPTQQLDKIPRVITVELNLRNFKQFEGRSEGYIYTIDYTKYSNNVHMFNKNPNSDVQFLIQGDVDFIQRQKMVVNWICTPSQNQIQRKGPAVLVNNKGRL